MSAPERNRSYLEIDSGRLTATTPVEFRQLLDYIRMRAGLTPSQIAIKTKIPRSQAYNLVAANRATLPSKPEQVREFVEACGLAPVQVVLVMNLWSELDRQAREQTAVRALSLVDGGAASGMKRHEKTAQILENDDTILPVLGLTCGDDSTYRRSRVGLDLLFLILDDGVRTRRALLLLLPIVLAFVAVVAILAVWAILQPDHASIIGGILAVGVLFPITTTLRRLALSYRR